MVAKYDLLTNDNYFDGRWISKYCGSTQYKDFMGTLGKRGCEARAMARINGEWKDKESTAMLVGSYVDAHYEGALDVFKAHHPNIFTKSGALKAEFSRAEDIIGFLEKDEVFQGYMSGEKQVTMIGEIGGVDYKIKIDSYLEDLAIVDLKVMASINKKHWVKDIGKISFVEYFGYDIQGAIYQEIVRQNTGKRLPFFIAGVSKEEYPNKEIIWIDDETLSDVLTEVEQNSAHIMALKAGEVEPIRCEYCDYCRSTKQLKVPTHYRDIEEDI